MAHELIVVLPIDDIPDGAEYPADTPLPTHCTLMHWFWLPHVAPLAYLGPALERLARRTPIKGLLLRSDQRVLFGPNEDIPVHTLERDNDLLLLHTKLLFFVARQGDIEEQYHRWVGAGYRPHVSDVGDRAFLPGSERRASRVVVLERNPETRARKALISYGFGI